LRLNRAVKFYITVLFLKVSITSGQIINSSQTYPTDFIPPLELRPVLAGSFGELRANHFHSGLDYRTNQREGYPVYAVADGYISRLRVQIGGFGNALYINHPNGYTSVYAHLQRFNDRTSLIVRDYQYRKQSYDVDFPLLPIEIPVKKGDIIAWSGNTGSSGGPHLHFELRDTKTEETINPQLFGIDIPDVVKPTVAGLYVYRLNKVPFTASTAKQRIQVTGSNGIYKAPLVIINGETGLGIVAYDQQLAGSNKNGLYSTELYLDNNLIYSAILERFAFHNSRAINSHIDYPAYLSSGVSIQKSFVEPGNPLGIYKNLINRGILNITDEEIHHLKYIIKDVKGNTSTLEFQVKNDPTAIIPASKSTPPGVKVFKYNELNEYATDDFKISIPKGLLYSDIDFTYSKVRRANGWSDSHIVHSRTTPLHEYFSLAIKPTRPVSPYLKDKLVIVNSSGAYAGGSFDDKEGFVKGSARAFGTYYVSIDTIAPTVRPINIAEEKDLSTASKIVLKISDNLSGIRSFSGYIDGKWVLMEYDLKTSTLWHTFDSLTGSGKHLFELRVSDMQQNIKIYSANFYK